MTFTFTLTPKQAQTIFNVTQCFLEEPELVKAIFPKWKERQEMRGAIRRFDNQLNRQYQKTGVEV